MNEEEIRIGEAILGVAVPIAASWIRSRLAAGDSEEKIKADLEALFAIADATIDAAEDAKFGPEPTTKP